MSLMLSFIFSSLLAGAIALSQFFLPSSSPLTAALPGLNGVFTGSSPTEIGIHDHHLTACHASPNCVVSEGQKTDADHYIEPIAYQGDRNTARDVLLKVLTVVPRTQVVEQTDDYIRIESTSRLLGFVDDGEFYFPEDESFIYIRSSSRLGESDLGVNRRRLEQIRLAMADLGA